MKTILHINGMMCSMCESHVNDAIRNNFYVKKVKSSKRKNQTVVVSENPLDEAKVRKVITEAGYDLVNIEIK